MSQNVWATIMPFGPVTNFLLAQKKIFGPALISGTVTVTLTFDPKINWVLPLPQGNHVAKFVKDPIYRTKVIVQKRPYCQKLYL